VFPARYELNSYIVFRKRLVSKRLRIREAACPLPQYVFMAWQHSNDFEEQYKNRRTQIIAEDKFMACLEYYIGVTVSQIVTPGKKEREPNGSI
jgi:hypothetical protein